MPCDRCPSDEAFYCVDCDKVFCLACNSRVHHVGTFNELHSIEEIDEDDDEESHGVAILSPIVDEILIIWVLSTAFVNIHIKEDYLASGDICPLTNMVQKKIASWDSVIFYALKASLRSFCNMEDSFWRLFLDVWVRGIVTETDSLLLLVSTVALAWIFTVSVIQLLFPVVALVYGLLVALWVHVEEWIPRWRIFLALEAAVKHVDVLSLSSDDDLPPPTKPRTRPATDYVDFTIYWIGRKSRYFQSAFGKARQTMNKVLLRSMLFAVGIRVVFIFFGFAPVIRSVLSLSQGFHTTIELHKEWFTSNSHTELSNYLVMRVLQIGFKDMASIAEFFANQALMILMLIIAAPVIASPIILRRAQQQRFRKRWKEEELFKQCLGPCMGGSQCQCLCIALSAQRDALKVPNDRPNADQLELQASPEITDGAAQEASKGAVRNRGRSPSPKPKAKSK